MVTASVWEQVRPSQSKVGVFGAKSFILVEDKSNSFVLNNLREMGGYKVKIKNRESASKKTESQRVNRSKRLTTKKITVAPNGRLGHIRMESITRVVFRYLKSWSAIPDTQTLRAPTSGQAFPLSRIAPAADRAEIFRREIYAGIRGYAGEYRARPDPPVRTVPWDDSGQA